MSINMNELITGGSVTVEDGKKAAEEFAPARKVAFTLNFSVPEGADGVAVADYVAALANGRQAALLNGKAPAEVAAKPAGTRRKAPAEPQQTAAPAQSDKDKLAAEAGLPTKDIVTKAPADELEDTPAPKATAKPAAEDDGLGDILGDLAPPPVTDQELGKAAQEKNGKMKGQAGWAPEKIRELVGKFVLLDGKPKPGAKLQEIPAAQRHEFLKQLDALK